MRLPFLPSEGRLIPASSFQLLEPAHRPQLRISSFSGYTHSAIFVFFVGLSQRKLEY